MNSKLESEHFSELGSERDKPHFLYSAWVSYNCYTHGKCVHCAKDCRIPNMRLEKLKNRSNFMHSLNSIPPRKQMHILKNLDDAGLSFLNDCLTCILKGHSRHLKLKPKDRKLATKMWLPYRTKLQTMSDPKHRYRVLRGIRRQTGEGLIFSALIAAAIPLITNLISKLIGGKNKN